MNDFVEFRAFFDLPEGARPVLRITGASVYRIWLNGVFAGYGPARAAPGFFRVDEWPLAAKAGHIETFRAPDGWHMIAEQDVDCKNL